MSDKGSVRVERPVRRGYRLLRWHEPIEATDEYLHADCETWEQVGERRVVGSGHSDRHVPMRRPFYA